MDLKQVAKRLLPPIILGAAKHLLWSNARLGAPEWEYWPDGWHTKDPRVKGWNVESILKSQKAKWPQFLSSMQSTGPLGVAHEALVPSNTDYGAHNTIMAYAYVLALVAQKKDRISLLDWGGGIGHYYVISRALLPKVEIDYHCKDVTILCQGGRGLVPEGTFYEDEEECFKRSYDLVLASTSLQYSEDWRNIVTRLASVSRSCLYVTRLPIVHRAASFVVIQRPYRYGYKTEYLCWFLNRQEFLNQVSSLGMNLVREFLIQERPFVHRAPEQGEYRGFLFRSQGCDSKG